MTLQDGPELCVCAQALPDPSTHQSASGGRQMVTCFGEMKVILSSEQCQSLRVNLEHPLPQGSAPTPP